MNKPIVPCGTCSNRRFGCHSICSRYAEYKEKQEKYNAAIRKEDNGIIYPDSQMKIMRGLKK